ncbi:restriction endonuclease subunit S [Pseudodesulfovibrio sp. F-1]|uniref:Restriction endonuclease subunit S n=1 Tax=Pseudodesulfovibrio alkaliphilus TaxID=2661613 RepID=A0A7K1KKZ5_9BACT|nr:restriction endonuclease subunit S [Pseudodesulfovibrio alkaliphilus]MUM76749.1 restriction endonuclease subunit S [Pseudodesulfovibrio alkaliphilus]
MGKYRAYPEYRDSGVEWLGEVPKHWKYSRIERVASFVKEPISPEQLKGLLVDHYSIPAVQEYGKGHIEEGDTVDSTKYMVVKDDILISKLNPRKRTSAIVKKSSCPIIASSEFIPLRPHAIHGRLLYYVVSGDLVGQFLEAHCDSATRSHQRITPDILCKLSIPLPATQEEQAQIAAFLDRETARIDRLIGRQEQLIELLKEKRQAVISHAVTKGLDPDAPMKDSGVEWLGEIPAHWEHSRIGYCATVGNGCTPHRDKESYWSDGIVPWLNSSKVNEDYIVDADQFVTKKAAVECHLPLVRPGSILIAITGEGKTRGMAALTKIDTTISQHLAFVRIQRVDVLPDFIHWYLKSRYDWIRYNSAGGGSTKAAITCSDIRKYPIPIPPKNEQIEIVGHLSKKMLTFGKLEESALKTIALLQERRTALISAAVTGKIDVREAV